MKSFAILFCLLFAQGGHGQTNDQPSASSGGATYRSESDDLISIEKVSYAPFIDNLNGIYARPLEAHLAKLLNDMHRWSVAGTVNIGNASLEELEENPSRVKEIAGTNSDGFFAAKIIKGPNGIAMKLDFFLAKDGKLLLQAEIKDFQQFDLNIVKEQLESLLAKVMHKIPYSGRVLSRDINRVTVDIGSRDGLQKNQVVSVIQVIKLNRHPKFNFLVSVEKEIIGKIKILKVDDTLSFGAVISERERGSIQKGNKLDALDFVSYTVNDSSLVPAQDNLDQRADAKVAFGKDAKAWKPQDAPSLGQVGARIGLAKLSQNSDLSTGAISAHDDFTPVAFLEGELWLTQNWTVHANVEIGFPSVTNPSGGNISEALTAYEMSAGYRFRFGPNAWSPYAEPFLGYMTHRLYADTVTPAAFTTMEYSGLKLGLMGGTPITADDIWYVGGKIAFTLSPHLTETPYTSGGSSTNNVNQFGVWVSKKMSEHWKLQGDLDFEVFSSDFSGAGTGLTSNSASEQFITLSVGGYYLF
jgi:hypothetical protein